MDSISCLDLSFHVFNRSYVNIDKKNKNLEQFISTDSHLYSLLLCFLSSNCLFHAFASPAIISSSIFSALLSPRRYQGRMNKSVSNKSDSRAGRFEYDNSLKWCEIGRSYKKKRRNENKNGRRLWKRSWFTRFSLLSLESNATRL